MNENNPPMMLPNGYVYGYNVSISCKDLWKFELRVSIIISRANESFISYSEQLNETRSILCIIKRGRNDTLTF